MSSAPSERASATSFTQNKGFWLLMAYAVILGVVGAAFALLFLGVIGSGGSWYTLSDTGWLGGQWWWVAVAAAAGLLVGLLRKALKFRRPPGRRRSRASTTSPVPRWSGPRRSSSRTPARRATTSSR